MFSRVRKRITYTNVLVTLALVFAMSGGALAAGKYIITSTKQIKPSVLAQLKGAKGAPGAQGPVGPQGAPGAQGQVGANGTNGKNGENGENGKNGATGGTGKSGATGGTGPTGPEGVCSTSNCVLPSGASEVGTWSLYTFSFGEFDVFASISFPVRLKEESSGVQHAFYFNRAETKEIEQGIIVGTSGCKIENLTPIAPKGTLCVFNEEEHLEGLVLFRTIESALGKVGGQYGTAGAFVFFNGIEPANNIRVRGVWAVTAP